MKSATKIRIALVACAVAVGAICVALKLARRTEDGTVPEGTQPAAQGDAKRSGRGVPRTERKPVNKPAKSLRPDAGNRTEKPVLSFSDDEDDDDGFTPEERDLSKRIEAALDEEDVDKAVACAKEALNCQNVEIRQAMVNTLGWFGVKGLPELTPFLADSDEDVRDSALNEWSMALSEIDDEPEKLGIVELAMSVLTDEDALEDISGEYVGADEKLAIESLLRIIEGGGSEQGVAKAKETYEFVTGDEFTDRAAAEKWIAEEYQPPDEPQSESDAPQAGSGDMNAAPDVP